MPNSPLRLGIGIWWQFATVAALFPMLPLYLAALGSSASDIAWLVSLQAFVGLAVTQVYGYLADTRMRRTTLLIAMTLGVAIVAAAFPLLPGTLGWLSLGMVALSLFFGSRVMIFTALVLDSRGGEESYGRIRLVGSLGFAVAAVVIGWLADDPRFTVAIMWPALVVFEVFFALSVRLLHDEPPERRVPLRPEGSRIGFREAQKLLLSSPLMRRFLLFVFLLQIFGGPPHILQIKLLNDLGTTALFTTACLSFAAVSEMSIFFFGNKLMRYIRLMPLMAMVPVAVAVRYGLVFVSPTPAAIFASNFFHLFTFGLAHMTGVLFIHREVPRELRSSGQTLFGLVFGLVAMMVGNLWMSGALRWMTTGSWGMTDIRALQILHGVAAGAALVSLLAWWPLKRAYEKKHRVRGFWVR